MHGRRLWWWRWRWWWLWVRKLSNWWVKIVRMLFSSVYILFCFAEVGAAAVVEFAVVGVSMVEVSMVEVAVVVAAVAAAADDEIDCSLKELSLVGVGLQFGPFRDTCQRAFDTSNTMTTY
jgi:hypothetical protein